MHMASPSDCWTVRSGLWATDGPQWTLGLEPRGWVLCWLLFIFCVASSPKHLRVSGVLDLCSPPLVPCPLQTLYYEALSIRRMCSLLHFTI